MEEMGSVAVKEVGRDLVFFRGTNDLDTTGRVETQSHANTLEGFCVNEEDRMPTDTTSSLHCVPRRMLKSEWQVQWTASALPAQGI